MYRATHGYAPDYIIWLHWLQLRRTGHIFAVRTASPSASLGCRQGWVILHSWSPVHVSGTHFRLTFVLHPAWTLLRSVSNHICFLLLTIYNNFLSLVTVYCSVFLANLNSSSRSLYGIGRPSVVCRLSVTFVRPTQAIEIFGNISAPCGTLAIHDLCIKILRRSSQGNPSVGGVKHKRGSRI